MAAGRRAKQGAGLEGCWAGRILASKKVKSCRASQGRVEKAKQVWMGES